MTTREQAGHIAELVHTIRPAWDTRAIIAALRHVSDRDLADTAWAAIRAAQNPAIEKAAVIAMDGGHWQRTIRNETPSTPRQDQTCPVDGHSGWKHNCSQCRSDQLAADENRSNDEPDLAAIDREVTYRRGINAVRQALANRQENA